MTKSKEENPTNENIAKIADGVAKGISLAGAGAKAVGDAIPGAKYIGKAAKVVAEAIRDPEGNVVEKAVCGAVKVVVQGAAAAPFIAEGAAKGAAAVPIAHPYAKAAGAIAGAVGVGPVANELAKPVGQAAQKVCHAAFDWALGRDKAKEAQKKAAEQQVVDTRSRYDTANLHAERRAYQQVMNNTRCFNLPFQTRPYSFINPQTLVWQAESRAVFDFRLRYGREPTFGERSSMSASLNSAALSMLILIWPLRGSRNSH